MVGPIVEVGTIGALLDRDHRLTERDEVLVAFLGRPDKFSPHVVDRRAHGLGDVLEVLGVGWLRVALLVERRGVEPALVTGAQRGGDRVAELAPHHDRVGIVQMVGVIPAEIVARHGERGAHGIELERDLLHQAVQRLFLGEQLVAEVDQLLCALVGHWSYAPRSVLL